MTIPVYFFSNILSCVFSDIFNIWKLTINKFKVSILLFIKKCQKFIATEDYCPTDNNKCVSVNPLPPSVPYMARLAKILILILNGITKKWITKKFIWASRLCVGRRKEPEKRRKKEFR